MKSNYITRAKKFIPALDEMLSDNFKNKYLIQQYIRAYNYTHRRNVIFSHGLTRYAFITSDYVIKIDYDEYEVENFGGCEQEYELYQNAVVDGMEYLFAEITPFMYNNKVYYIMPRIKGIGKTDDDATRYMNRKERQWCRSYDLGDLHSFNYGWRNKHICIIDYATHS